MSFPAVGFRDLDFDEGFRWRWVGGRRVQQWVPIGMPRVRNSFQHCVFYLFGLSPKTGKRIGPGATGAFVARPSTDLAGEDHFYAVTNRHVIENCWTEIRANTFGGEPRFIQTEDVLWRFSKTHDLAIIDVTDLLDRQTDFAGMIYTSDFLNDIRIRQFNVGIGDSVVMMGLFADHDGGPENMPVARFGNIAAMPDAHQPVSAGPNDRYPAPAFLNDMRSRTGFSGSPIWVWRTPGDDLNDYSPEGGHLGFSAFPSQWTDGRVFAHTFLCFLGIHRAQFPEETWLLADDPTGRLPKQTKIRIASAMTIAIPAWEIAAMIDDDPSLKAQRIARDQRPERIERANGRIRYSHSEES